MVKAVVFDADKTLWDHHNISDFSPPLTVKDDTVTDNEGRKLTLFEGVRETLAELKSLGLILGVATWNNEQKTQMVFSALGLTEYFDLIISSELPFKYVMISKFIAGMSARRIYISPEDIMFIDDRKGHFGNIWMYVGRVKCVEMWNEVRSYKEILNLVKEQLKI